MCSFFRMVLQETYELQDYKIYDTGATDKTSTYNSYGLTLTHDTDHYTISKGTTGDYLAYVFKNSISLGSNFEIYCDMKRNSGTNFGIVLTDTVSSGVLNDIDRVQLFGFASAKGYYVADKNVAVDNQTVSNALPIDTWLTFYLRVENGNVTAKILQGTTEVYSATTTINNITHYPYVSVSIGGNNVNADWKNLKVYSL